MPRDTKMMRVVSVTYFCELKDDFNSHAVQLYFAAHMLENKTNKPLQNETLSSRGGLYSRVRLSILGHDWYPCVRILARHWLGQWRCSLVLGHHNLNCRLVCVCAKVSWLRTEVDCRRRCCVSVIDFSLCASHIIALTIF